MTQSQKRLRDEVRDFVKGDVPKQLLIDMDADRVRYPRQFLEKAAARNLLGLRVSAEYGGRGLKWEDEVIANEEIGVLGSSLSCLYTLVSIIGETIELFGTEEQKQKYLCPMLEGKLTCAEALTEPRGGSDFFGATTIARRDGDHYILNGQKRFVVGAEGADFFSTYVRTRTDAPGKESLSLLIVDRDAGVECRYLYGLMGTRGGGAGRIVFQDVPVPVKNRIGDENAGADIFNQMMIPERMVSASQALGTARAALEIATKYADKRKAFGQVIRKFQAVGFRIADSITKLDAARGLVWAAARIIDANGGKTSGPVRRAASEAKKFATDAAWEIVNNAMQIMGGIGYTSVYPIERFLRDLRLGMIWTGTNEVMNLIIQHEYRIEVLAELGKVRGTEADAADANQEEEKVYE